MADARASTADLQNDLGWALKALRDPDRLNGYRIASNYYDGAHDLRFVTDKWRSVFGRILREARDNLCPAVVDSVSDRLRVVGVNSDSDQATADAAFEIWNRNRMDIRAPETHHEALLNGDGFALVWPNQAGEAVIWSLPAHEVAVAYDRNEPGKLTRAARLWQDVDGDWRWHLDVYYPDRVERWISQQRPQKSGVFPSSYSSRSFDPWPEGCQEWSPVDPADASGGDGLAAEGTIVNTIGRVPLVHFPNQRYHCYGISELANVVPLQDALNKALCDMLVAMEFSAFPQRWATGVSLDDDEDGPAGADRPFEPGIDRVWAVANELAKFGEFKPADLTQYVEVQESLRSEIARVSGTPLHYLFITRGDFPSGEAMKSAEARFTRKVENRQTAFGNSWENVLAMALQIEGADTVDPSVLSVQWESASPLAIDTAEGELAPATVTETIHG